MLRWDELADGTSQSRTCDEAGRYTLRLTRDNKGTDRVPVELLVRVEPPVTGGTGDPEQAARVEFAGQPAGAGQAVRGGGSFNEATTLAGPGRYAETVYYGEQLFYRVKLDWGQGLAYRITYGGVPDGETVNVATSLFNPVRDEIDSDTTAYTGNTMTLPFDGKPIATTRVMYLNREGGAADIRKMAVDGWYYIMVKLGAADGAGGVPGQDRPGGGRYQGERARVQRRGQHAGGDAERDAQQLAVRNAGGWLGHPGADRSTVGPARTTPAPRFPWVIGGAGCGCSPWRVWQSP